MIGPVLDRALETALTLLRADRGNIQIVDPATGALRIAVHHGFSAAFLEYFAIIGDDGSACGRAATGLSPTVIADVRADPGFEPHREIAVSSRFQPVQSTPLIDQTGRLVGMISTHYPRPYRPPDRDLWIIQQFGRLVGAAMTAGWDSPPPEVG